MGNQKKESQEIALIRSGDILNSLGILRSVKMYDGVLKKEDYIELIKKNYLLDRNVPQSIVKKIENIWLESINLFCKMGIDNESTSSEIKIRDIPLISSSQLK